MYFIECILCSDRKEMRLMEELKTNAALPAPALSRRPLLRRTPLLEGAAALAALLGGGWAALWVMELLFRLVGVA